MFLVALALFVGVAEIVVATAKAWVSAVTIETATNAALLKLSFAVQPLSELSAVVRMQVSQSATQGQVLGRERQIESSENPPKALID